MNATASSEQSRPLVLVISPTPTHATNRGNRVRLLNLCNQLERWGYCVHLLHVRMQGGDHEAMRAHWGERYHWVDYLKPPRVESLAAKWLRRVRQLYDQDVRYAVGVDDWYIPEIDRAVRALADKYAFKAVVVNYVFLSRALLVFDRHVLKIVDTLNRFALRHRMLLQHGIQPYFFSTTEAEEAKGLNRADIVIGIQESESALFRMAVEPKVRVITVGHLNSIGQLAAPKSAPQARMLYVASDSPINLSGANWFIQECLPLVRQRLPAAELVVAGRVCAAIPDGPGIRKLGELENLSVAYGQADVVINPVRTGTGLNIKSIEALGQSAPMVASEAGSRGLESGVGRAFLRADTAEAFAEAVVGVLSDAALAHRLSDEAREYAIAFQNRSLQDLSQALGVPA